jgi:hypothetical protein
MDKASRIPLSVRRPLPADFYFFYPAASWDPASFFCTGIAPPVFQTGNFFCRLDPPLFEINDIRLWKRACIT